MPFISASAISPYNKIRGGAVPAPAPAGFSFGNALAFDGVNDFVSFPAGSDIGSNTDKMTVSFWANIRSDGFFWLGSRADPNNLWLILKSATNTNGILCIARGSGEGASSYQTYNSSVFNGYDKWTHFAMVYDGNAAVSTQRIKMYFDGALIGYNYITPAPTTFTGSTAGSNLSIGKNTQSGAVAEMEMNELAIWYEVLTDEEISYLYNGGNGNFASDIKPESLRRYYRFNGSGDDSALIDEGTDGVNGTLEGFTRPPEYWIEGQRPLFLDLFPGAAAAYSLRKLRADYTGSAIRVRRSDDAEQDINFINNELDTASLLSFVGAGDGFVATWYDQSGLGNDATQVAGTNQPKIVSSGVIELENGKPAITTQGSKNLNTGIVNLGVSGDIPLSFYSVQNNQSTSDRSCLIGLTDNTTITDRRRLFIYAKDDATKISLRMFGGNCVYNLPPPTNQVLFSCNYTSGGGAIDSRVNSTDLTVSSFSNSGLNIQANSGFMLFSGNTATAPQLTTTESASQGSLQECIFYLNDKSASTSAIESNINSHYNIY